MKYDDDEVDRQVRDYYAEHPSERRLARSIPLVIFVVIVLIILFSVTRGGV